MRIRLLRDFLHVLYELKAREGGADLRLGIILLYQCFLVSEYRPQHCTFYTSLSSNTPVIIYQLISKDTKTSDECQIRVTVLGKTPGPGLGISLLYHVICVTHWRLSVTRRVVVLVPADAADDFIQHSSKILLEEVNEAVSGGIMRRDLRWVLKLGFDFLCQLFPELHTEFTQTQRIFKKTAQHET